MVGLTTLLLTGTYGRPFRRTIRRDIDTSPAKSTVANKSPKPPSTDVYAPGPSGSSGSTDVADCGRPQSTEEVETPPGGSC